MKTLADRFPAFLFAAALLLCAALVHAQVPVAPAPPLHFQFLNGSGLPLANGKIYSYAAGTTTIQYTYIDATGGTYNQDPILLDATGSPTNGSVPTGIFLANLSYKFVAYDANGVFQWSVDNVAGYFGGILNQANTWSAAQTFSAQIFDTLTDNQMVFGTPGNQTTLDAPPPSTNITIHFPVVSGTLAPITFAPLTDPSINGTAMPWTPGTYTTQVNNNSIGTTISSLVKYAAGGSVTITATSDTSGILGLCVVNCGTSGSAVIQQSGQTACNYDGAFTAPDYVVNSSTTSGDCHDSGVASPAAPPTGMQIIGQAASSNGSAANGLVNLWGPGHFMFGLGSGTVTFATGPGAGTGPTISCGSASCQDNAGVLTLTTGTSPGTSGKIADVIFSAQYSAFGCTFADGNSNASALAVGARPNLVISAFGSGNKFSLYSGGTALAGSTQYIWNYTCN